MNNKLDDSGKHETQLIEVQALPNAREIQKITASAWGWQQEIQRLNLQVLSFHAD